VEQSAVNESVLNFKGNFDLYLRKKRDLKVMLTLSPLEPFAVYCMLTATVLRLVNVSA